MIAKGVVVLDEHRSGEVDPDEFIETLYRMKCGDDKTASRGSGLTHPFWANV